MDKVVFFTVLIGVYVVFYRTEFVLLIIKYIKNMKKEKCIICGTNNDNPKPCENCEL